VRLSRLDRVALTVGRVEGEARGDGVSLNNKGASGFASPRASSSRCR
jgi:hypothetical protein